MKPDRHARRRGIRTLGDASDIPAPWIHPLAGASWSHYRDLHFRHRGSPPRSRLRRWFNAFVLLERSPHAVIENWAMRKSLAAHVLVEAPLFVIGHWGSGTTRLHQLLARDPNFATPDTGDTFLPWNLFATSRYCRAYVRPSLPTDRLFDQVAASLEEPQEEEMALALLSPISYFHSLFFPSDASAETQRALFPETAPTADREAFERAYCEFHHRISYRYGGRRILFKNPASTSRLTLLKRIFPGARFIHLVRDPTEVYAASIHRTPYLLNGFALEDFRDLDLHELTLATYEALMQRYLLDRDTLAADEIVELRFEELERDPLGTVATIYERFRLPDSDHALSSLSTHLDSEPPYDRRPRHVAPEALADVARRWRFSFEAWGYPLPEDGEADLPCRSFNNS